MLRTSVFTKRDSLWESLSPALQGRVKAALLNAMATESVAQVRHKLIDTTCELGGYIFNKAEKAQEGSALRAWPEMLQFLFQAVQHQQPGHRETGLRIFTRLSPFLAALSKVSGEFVSCAATKELTRLVPLLSHRTWPP
jgi:hypothetical protein